MSTEMEFVNKALYAVVDLRSPGVQYEVAQYDAAGDAFQFFGTDDYAKRTEVNVLARLIMEAVPAYPATPQDPEGWAAS